MYGWIRMLVAVAATGLLLAAAAQGGSAPPMLAWSPTTSSGAYDYGTLDTGADETKSFSFTLTNSGGMTSGTLTIALSDSSAFTITADNCMGRSLGPTRSCGVTVKYAPTANRESDSGTLTAIGEHASVRITLAGESGAPDLTLSPGTLHCASGCLYAAEFGLVSANSSETRTFTLTNGGKGTSETLQVISGGDAGLSFANDRCTGNALGPSATCTFDLTFTAGAGCPAEGFPGHVDIVGDIPAFVDYIDLETVGHCL